MPIQFTCPHCGLETNVADQYVGQTGPCAGCEKMVTITPSAMASDYAAPRPNTKSPATLFIALGVGALALLVCGGLLMAILLPAVSSARSAARRAVCTNNLRQISIAMHTYASENGCFPPAYVADEDGRPMHSWRVLILPYLDEQWLYDMYDFDEPWDSPANADVAASMPGVFRCAEDSTIGANVTSYMMIVGPGMISDGPGATAIEEIADGTSNTFMLVEVYNSGVNWSAPDDLDSQQINFTINGIASPGISSGHPDVVNAALCDGSVRAISDSTDPETVKAMATIAGGEATPVVNY